MAAAPRLPATFVVDCSIVAGVFLPDEQSPLAAAVREQCPALTLVAPRILRVEFANVALTARRRGRLDEAQFRALVSQGAQFPIAYDAGEPGLVDYTVAAFELGLTSYDYAYLDCARRRGLPLATLDRELLSACAQAGVEVLTDPARIAEARPRYPAPRRSAAAVAAARRAARGA
jgi:predicted nucleic acid-binding protein